MAIDLQTYNISRNDFTKLKNEFNSPYLTLLPDYKEILHNLDTETVELFLTEEEISDLDHKLDLLYLKDHKTHP